MGGNSSEKYCNAKSVHVEYYSGKVILTDPISEEKEYSFKQKILWDLRHCEYNIC